MNKKLGFTLIELVIVIIVLGILAAVAIPKFINLQSDARASAIKGVKAALEDASTLTYAKASIVGKESLSQAILSLNNNSIDIVYGYPAMTENSLRGVLTLDESAWNIEVNESGATFGTGGTVDSIIITISSSQTTENCQVEYTAAKQDERPNIEAIVDGC